MMNVANAQIAIIILVKLHQNRSRKVELIPIANICPHCIFLNFGISNSYAEFGTCSCRCIKSSFIVVGAAGWLCGA